MDKTGGALDTGSGLPTSRRLQEAGGHQLAEADAREGRQRCSGRVESSSSRLADADISGGGAVALGRVEARGKVRVQAGSVAVATEVALEDGSELEVQEGGELVLSPEVDAAGMTPTTGRIRLSQGGRFTVDAQGDGESDAVGDGVRSLLSPEEAGGSREVRAAACRRLCGGSRALQAKVQACRQMSAGCAAAPVRAASFAAGGQAAAADCGALARACVRRCAQGASGAGQRREGRQNVRAVSGGGEVAVSRGVRLVIESFSRLAGDPPTISGTPDDTASDDANGAVLAETPSVLVGNYLGSDPLNVGCDVSNYAAGRASYMLCHIISYYIITLYYFTAYYISYDYIFMPQAASPAPASGCRRGRPWASCACSWTGAVILSYVILYCIT